MEVEIGNKQFLPLRSESFFFLIIISFIYFWLHWVFIAVRGLFFFFFFFVSSCGERGILFIAVHGLLIAVASLIVEHGV